MPTKESTSSRRHFALTKKQKVVSAVALALASVYPAEYQRIAKQGSPPASSIVFVNTLIAVFERAESPLGVICIVVLATMFYHYRKPKDQGTVDDGYELLEHAMELERNGRVQKAIAAYDDIARRYSGNDAGRDAQKSKENLQRKIA